MSTISETRLSQSRDGDGADTPDPGGSRVMVKHAIRYDRPADAVNFAKRVADGRPGRS